LLYKIPIKSIVAPLLIRFTYGKEGVPSFNSLQSDLQVYLSETELQPHRTYKIRIEQDEEANKAATALSKNGPSKKLKELEKIIIFRNQPKEIACNPQVQPKSKPGYSEPRNKLTGGKVQKFHSKYLYLALMSEVGGYKVQVKVNFKEQLPDEDEDSEQNQIGNRSRSAFANYKVKIGMIEKEVHAMTMDPYYQSYLIKNQIDAQKRIQKRKMNEFGSPSNKLRLQRLQEQMKAQRSQSEQTKTFFEDDDRELSPAFDLAN